jgi:hypothetical protein
MYGVFLTILALGLAEVAMRSMSPGNDKVADGNDKVAVGIAAPIFKKNSDLKLLAWGRFLSTQTHSHSDRATSCLLTEDKA